MSWINDLYETYEANFDLDNIDFKVNNSPLPISHTTQMAQIEIIIDEDGEFFDAKAIIDKSEALTIIPVTEDSAARSSGPCAHPLEDKLEYIAGDYETYTGKNNKGKYGLYIDALSKWCESKYSCKYIDAVKVYVQKNCMIKDLITKGVLKVSEDGVLTNDKIAGIDQREAFVRFSVLDDEDGRIYELYRNKELFDLYMKYYKEFSQDVDLCYATGMETACSQKHGAKIRGGGDKAKLISANDSDGFTYRGRFSEASQAASVGYEVSQKAHSALRWLTANQGFKVGDMTVVAWAISGSTIPDINKGNMDEPPERGYTDEGYAERLRLASNGYKQDLSDNDHIIVMGVEAATKGRLSIRFYYKIKGSEFIDNIENWYKSCYWRYGKLIGAPSPYKIAATAFGNKNNKAISDTVEKLLPCIISNRKIPRDIVNTAVLRVGNRYSFESFSEWNKAIEITCALIRKKIYDYSIDGNEERKEWSMSLDRNEKDRSYLFGRLLGAAQKLEGVAIFIDDKKAKDDKEGDDSGPNSKRQTAAERFYVQFKRRPRQTWELIDRKLQPYIQKLGNNSKYVIELRQIYELMRKEDFESNEPLTELYLLGYNCQLNSYYQKNVDKEEK